MATGKVFLFPSLMAQCAPSDVLPQKNIELISAVKFFVVEELRTARRFLKACNKAIDIDSLSFSVLNEHTQHQEVAAMLQPALEGNDIGIISEAGCPAVADPGADLVAVAQCKGIEVVPLVGPSSILLSLMGSGFNGQSFAFLGYLPVDAAKRTAALRQMERDIRRNQTQIFIETPYRNNRLVAELADSLPTEMMLCVAADITAPTQSIVTRSIKDWKKASYDYNKRPAIFLLYHA